MCCSEYIFPIWYCEFPLCGNSLYFPISFLFLSFLFSPASTQFRCFFLACHPSLLVCINIYCSCSLPFLWQCLGTNCSLVVFLLLQGRCTGLFSLRMKWLLQSTKHARKACEWRESLNLLFARLCSELSMCLWVSYVGG